MNFFYKLQDFSIMKKELRTTFNPRQYMFSNDFEIYYYSDIDMKNIQNHSHTYYEFYFFISGSVSINIDGTNYPLRPGDIILIPPNIVHYANILDPSIPYQRFVLWITEKYFVELTKQFPEYGYLMELVHMSQKYIHHYDVIIFNKVQSKPSKTEIDN